MKITRSQPTQLSRYLLLEFSRPMNIVYVPSLSRSQGVRGQQSPSVEGQRTRLERKRQNASDNEGDHLFKPALLSALSGRIYS